MFRLERANLKISKDGRGDSPHDSRRPLVGSVVSLVGSVQLWGKLRALVVSDSTRRKMRRAAENAEHPVRTNPPDSERRVAVSDRESAMRPVAYRGVFRGLAGNLARAGTR